MNRSAFTEDVAAHRVAASLGFDLVRRYRKIEIFDKRAVTAAGFVSKEPKPDYAAISDALDQGREVPGARFASTEYVMRARGESCE